jgi:hypothetical protein
LRVVGFSFFPGNNTGSLIAVAGAAAKLLQAEPLDCATDRDRFCARLRRWSVSCLSSHPGSALRLGLACLRKQCLGLSIRFAAKAPEMQPARNPGLCCYRGADGRVRFRARACSLFLSALKRFPPAPRDLFTLLCLGQHLVLVAERTRGPSTRDGTDPKQAFVPAQAWLPSERFPLGARPINYSTCGPVGVTLTGQVAVRKMVRLTKSTSAISPCCVASR